MSPEENMRLEAIYSKYYGPVKAYIRRLGGREWTEDLTQETFLKVQRNIHDLRNTSNPGPWVFQIARNRTLDHFRSRAAKTFNQEPVVFGEYVEPIGPLRMEQEEMSGCVQEKVALLADPLRSVFLLSERDRLGTREIGEALGISQGNVKVRLHRARKALKEILERDCTFERDKRCVMVCLPRTT